MDCKENNFISKEHEGSKKLLFVEQGINPIFRARNFGYVTNFHERLSKSKFIHIYLKKRKKERKFAEDQLCIFY